MKLSLFVYFSYSEYWLISTHFFILTTNLHWIIFHLLYLKIFWNKLSQLCTLTLLVKNVKKWVIFSKFIGQVRISELLWKNLIIHGQILSLKTETFIVENDKDHCNKLWKSLLKISQLIVSCFLQYFQNQVHNIFFSFQVK